MKFCTIKKSSEESAAVWTDSSIIPLETLNLLSHNDWAVDLFDLIRFGQIKEIQSWYGSLGKVEVEKLRKEALSSDNIVFGPLYRQPRKIWGIGLNYVDHAKDLSEKAPQTEPASFMKADTTIIGHNEEILIPTMSEKTTGEAELGVVIGKKCKNVEIQNWLEVVVGFTTVIDVTAEDILRKNPRYLTLSKNFDTFFSFGPQLLTPDELSNVKELKVATVINGSIHAQNHVRNMTFPPDFLVSFHSRVMTLLPGDIISTGTPRSVQIKEKDLIECRIDGFEPLKNTVRDLKINP
ncbi:MAG: fumarylacetoacetate hydrolase [Candidatus Lokiarchaeota archaeon]|nr:fumarylacetoacetate hydrolase [Candidatus Lokiarchaeota archaeon]MBD3339689.1 fumarylacetoacetate hydrolase [Candidatus Lokiarchaeota archaeon]